MKYIVTISRTLLGWIFVVFGLNGFLHLFRLTNFGASRDSSSG